MTKAKTTAVAEKPQSPVQTLRTMLETPQMMQQIKTALPRHMTPERMIRVALTALQRNPALLECDQRSICGAIVEASELGLEPNGVMGHAYLVPFRNNKVKPTRTEAQLMVGYKGLIDLARRSGKVTVINAEVVYARDEYKVIKGLHPDLIHVPYDEDDERGEIVAAYATAKIEGSDEPQFEALTLKDINALRARSRASKNGPWVTDYAWMCKKSAIRQLCKLLPCSIEEEKKVNPAFAIERDDLRDKSIMAGGDFVEVEAKPVSGLDGLADSLEGEETKDEALAEPEGPAEPVETAAQSDLPDGGNDPEKPEPAALKKLRAEQG